MPALAFTYVHDKSIWVSVIGEVCCLHGKIACKYLSTTAKNPNRYFWTCDGCDEEEYPRGWIWQDELLRFLDEQNFSQLAATVANSPARLPA